MDYRATLNLPQTGFAMKANLVQNEPKMLKKWEQEDLYGRIQRAAEGKPLFVLHDGPPYANGNIHLGTAFNKILKDIIMRSRRLAGFNAPYVPGWDCHGLPIEHNVDKELGEKKNTIPKISKRAACRKYAEKFIKIQKEEFKRLGVLGDWDHPYLSMSFDYEAAIAREFKRFLFSGAVVRNKKPVYWCSTCVTALAEAEVEYANHKSLSLYVKFPLADDCADIAPVLAGSQTSVLIWTTTPWTLPANLAIAFHPDFVYAAVEVGEEVWIMARERVAAVMEQAGIDRYQIAAEFSARALENRHCRHPFMARDSLLTLADYVTLDTGTGCVHTAPGHGADDYQTGLRYGLETLSPVDDFGVFTAEAGLYAGQHVPEVNQQIADDLAKSGMLLHQHDLEHSYPHCWRCKKPVIYRATPQWFISMEKNGLRAKALAEIERVTWTPAWGMQRIYAMIENRPDWCLSRQRSWGVPITVITCDQCGEIVKDEAVAARIDQLFNAEGADAWFRHGVEAFLGDGYTCRHCGAGAFKKEEDILDVWFDSGVSHAAVLEKRPELRSPADLYLEGSDQHRGWFHSALLTSVGTRGRAPYKGVLTHGYVVDGQGRKMSKSVGNVILPGEVIGKFGAEILRLWVASEDYRDDVKVSDEILRQISDSYRKIRNTIRYLLSNLADFDSNFAVPFAGMAELDQWAMSRFEELRKKVVEDYGRYEFHGIYQAINYFCGTTMSALYLDIIKDRLYADGTRSSIRRSAQTALYTIVSGLLRLISPILPFTASEAWDSLHHRGADAAWENGIFFSEFPQAGPTLDSPCEERFRKLLRVRGEITKALEIARRDKVIGHPLEAQVEVSVGGEWADFISQETLSLRQLAIVSGLTLTDTLAEGQIFVSEEIPELKIAVRPAQGEKCERCWTRSQSVGEDATHPALCARCLAVLAAGDVPAGA
ncbi:MAG: isoleucine--tRNA ligase [Desulfobulbaceae bacterium]|jgi:isoleucyl-tRNA synthetase|nr:isoleucine--tRNA ligase [Desulfobulbaceae bacterium]